MAWTQTWTERMRAFLDILGFELRTHLSSPLFYVIALLFFLLHLLTITQVGIHLGDNDLIAVNSTWLIFRTELVLGAFGMLPAIIFVVTAITRDHERNTAALFFTTPVPRLSWLLGRFSAGTLAAVLVGFAGSLGSLAGPFMPWVEQSRIGPFDWWPYAVSFGALGLPNLLVFCAFFFSIAALTRSAALSFAAALGLLVLEVVVNGNAGAPVPQWLLLADPFAGLPVAEAGRYWTVSELNSQMPTAFLLPNRVLWLGLAFLALALTCWRYRMDLAQAPFFRRRPRRKAATTAPPIPAEITHSVRFDVGATLLQFRSHLKMDLRCVLQGRFFWLVLLLGVWGTISEVRGATSILIGLPLYPVTSVMLGFFRNALLQFVLLLLIYYSAVLVHRERDCGLAEMTGSAPCPAWIMAASKTIVLCGIVTSLLLVSMLTSIALQAAAGYTDFELGLYLQGVFIYNGFYFYMLCALAVFVQVLSPGKWSGMILLLVVFVALLSLDGLGFEHLLYGFRIPDVVYSDMNGFGHFRLPTYTLIAYWSAFCALLLVLAHLLFPSGYYASLRERLRDARIQIRGPVARTSAVALVVFAGLGAFIFYNTNVLNDYKTRESNLQLRARYELDYGRYRNEPAPSFVDVDLKVELHPEERRLESRGSGVLRNNKHDAIVEFAVALDPRMRVNAMIVEGATPVIQDTAQGFYLFSLASPLQPGGTLTMRWDLERVNQGFVNSAPDNELVANGTFVSSVDIMPVPGYNDEREVTGGDRARFGLPPAARLPALGDPSHLDDLRFGVDSRSTFRVVCGTTADQIAVAPGVLKTEWVENGRRYFEYVVERPIWPHVSLLSARYTVARDDWNGVSLEVYHDAKHPWNVPTMLATARTGLEYFSREFSPYPHSYFRILEYPRYRSAAKSFPGTIPYAENIGFMTDLRGWAQLDYATLHELAHQWWGEMAYGARMQGRQVLNETLAQYSTFMVFKQYADPVWLRRILVHTQNGYLEARGGEAVAEQPVLLTEDQGYISYNKAALALFALQELIGAERVHRALRSYLGKFAEKGPPFPTSRDLVAELRAVAGPEYQPLITDLFERIMLYDTSVVAAEARAVGDGYEVTLEVDARQYESNGTGVETEVPLDTWFQIAVFPESGGGVIELTPLYLEHHRLRSGAQRITVRVQEKPGTVAVDPFHLMIDRTPNNNVLNLGRQ